MIQNLIGKKQIFAIEYSVISINKETAFGNCLIWLQGNSLGGLEGECYLNMICHWLERRMKFKELLFLKDTLYNLSDVELFKYIEEKATYEVFTSRL